MEKLVSRKPHKLQVAGSSPVSATNQLQRSHPVADKEVEQSTLSLFRCDLDGLFYFNGRRNMWTAIGFQDSSCNFTASIVPVNGQQRRQIVAGIFCALLFSSKYRKNGVVAIREVVTNPLSYGRWLVLGHTNERSTVLFALNQYWLITYKCPSTMLHKTKVSPAYNEYTVDSNLVHDLFSEFDLDHINETMWDMFSESISNPNVCIDAATIASRAHVYKELTRFLAAIEPPKTPRKSDFNNN